MLQCLCKLHSKLHSNHILPVYSCQTRWHDHDTCLVGRTGSVKPNAIRLTSCRLCGWTKTSRVHMDKLQVSFRFAATSAWQNYVGPDVHTDAAINIRLW